MRYVALAPEWNAYLPLPTQNELPALEHFFFFLVCVLSKFVLYDNCCKETYHTFFLDPSVDQFMPSEDRR